MSQLTLCSVVRKRTVQGVQTEFLFSKTWSLHMKSARIRRYIVIYERLSQWPSLFVVACTAKDI